MTWLPDGKICSVHKSCQMRKRTGLWKWGRREVSWKALSEMQLNACHLFISNFFLSFFPPSLPFPFFFTPSFVLLSSPHFSSSRTFDPSSLPHFLIPLTRKMWFFFFLLPRGIPMNTLCWLVCACEIHNRLRFPGHKCSEGECRRSGFRTERASFWIGHC